MTEREAFMKAVLADPSEANRLVFADWLEDHGEEELARWFRQPHPPGEITLTGTGTGTGTGDHGDGNGYGYGYRDGHGDGYDSGYGEGSGDGQGRGYGPGEPR